MDARELIAKLEAAEEPSRELDAEIWRLIGLTEAEEAHCRSWRRRDGWPDLTRDQFIRAWAPEFTTSLDAALGLVPEGWDWCVVWAERFGDVKSATCQLIHRKSREFVTQHANTPAITISIAALKAREVGNG